jgi:hypothetical protein
MQPCRSPYPHTHRHALELPGRHEALQLFVPIADDISLPAPRTAHMEKLRSLPRLPVQNQRNRCRGGCFGRLVDQEAAVTRDRVLVLEGLATPTCDAGR